jgi:phosphate transport system permease protein
VPDQLKESAYALGSTTWEVVWDVVLPYTRSAVIGGIMLGLGRALGETMAVTFVLGNAHRLTPSLLEPGNSIASAPSPTSSPRPTRCACIGAADRARLVLFLITFVVLAIAKLMLRS